ncbi:TVP38/TMEM64 family protein [Pseudonocardia sp.]|uniref:TVP38/TMEM64 family protein n=1 Tax=Pseudonocardia sp. TaxID=60912 RepID=UPI00260BAFAE|nr:TVP38/TMEM64 family protein [Pseudonocardia sp.]
MDEDTAAGPRPDRWWIRPAILLVVLGIGIAVAVRVGVPPVEDVRAWVGAAGWAGPVAYAALYGVLTLTPVPATVLSIAAGLLFGMAGGLGVVMTGALLGAVGAFALARVLGRRAVERVDSDRLRRLDALLRRRGVLAVIGVRLVPVLPFAALNYLSGLTAVRTRDYVVGTAVGILPGATAYVAIGAFGSEPGSLPFLLAVGGLAVLVVGGLVVARRRRAAGPPVDEPARDRPVDPAV